MPRTYRVKAADTVERIAIRECGSARFTNLIIRDNQLQNARFIFVGQTLILRCGDAGITPDSPPAAAAAPTAPDPTQPNTPPLGTGEKRLSVPYYSQEDPTAQYASADCGPASLRMMIGWHRLRNGQPDPATLTIDELSRAMGLRGGQFSFPIQLVQVGRRYHLPLIETLNATLPRIQQEIDAGRPVISLIHYGSISKRQNQEFTRGHFVVVIGYTASEVILNDPDWWGVRRNEGASLRVPRAEFEQAIGRRLQSTGNNPHWAVFVRPEAVNPR
jgi:hypothetical protein